VRVAVPNFVEIGHIVAEIRRFFVFQEAAVCHLAFLKIRNFSGQWVERIRVRHLAKFRGDWSSRCRDVAIYRFSNMTAVRYLRFGMRAIGPHTKGI